MNRREFLKIACGAAAAAVTTRALSGLAAAPPADDKPNFVILFVDDMGYGDIEPFGSKLNKTPNLNQMAAEGMKLTSFYVPAAVCTPSRAGLMTGSYPKRVGLATGSWFGVLMPGDKWGLSPEEITIADVLKAAGYKTGCFGKWHLGDQPQFLPTKHGFDYFFGLPYSHDMWVGHKKWDFPPLPLMRNETVLRSIDTPEAQAELCKLINDEAVAFIRENKDRPFLAYVPYCFIHHPRLARKRFVDDTPNPDRGTGATVEEVDWSVGEILKALRECGIAEKTLVIFTSDNGGPRGSVNLPLRGGKGSQFEGGMREPTLAWWPGKIPPASVCDELATSMDLLPTFAALAGAKTPTDRVIDGHDILPLLTAQPGAKTPYEMFFYYGGNTLRAVRSGPWKLFTNGELYNLDEDISEKKNIATRHPDVVARLRTYLEKARRDLGSGREPGKNCRPVGVATNPRTLLPRPGVEGTAARAPLGPNRKPKPAAGKTK